MPHQLAAKVLASKNNNTEEALRQYKSNFQRSIESQLKPNNYKLMNNSIDGSIPNMSFEYRRKSNNPHASSKNMPPIALGEVGRNRRNNVDSSMVVHQNSPDYSTI